MSIALTRPLYQSSSFGWFSIVRLGMVQAAIGAIVVMTTSTLNRIMVVELALQIKFLHQVVLAFHGQQLKQYQWEYLHNLHPIHCKQQMNFH